MPTIGELVKLLHRLRDSLEVPLSVVADKLHITVPEAKSLVETAASAGDVEWCTRGASCMLSGSRALKLRLTLVSADLPDKKPKGPYYCMYWLSAKDGEDRVPLRLQRHRDSWDRHGLRKDMEAVLQASDGPDGDDPEYLEHAASDRTPTQARAVEIKDVIDKLVELAEHQGHVRLSRRIPSNDLNRLMKKLRCPVEDYYAAATELKLSIDSHLIGVNLVGWSFIHETLDQDLRRAGKKCAVCGGRVMTAPATCLGCLRPDYIPAMSKLSGDSKENSQRSLRTSGEIAELQGVNSRGVNDHASDVLESPCNRCDHGNRNRKEDDR